MEVNAMTLTDEPLNVLHDWHLVEILVPTTQGEPLQLDGMARLHGTNQLDLQLFPSDWPVSGLDPHAGWHLQCDQGMHFHTIRASLEKQDHPRRIRLRIEQHEVHEHQRRNLRVETAIYLAFWKDQPGEMARPQPARTQVSLSQQGLSFLTEDTLRTGTLLSLQMILPGTTLESLHCEAQVLSLGNATRKGRKMALKIVRITSEDREKIAMFCLAEHFRGMQAKTRLMALMMGSR
ncbi:MAG: hypothetical protein EOM70_11395 [Clostridia bacterium]|jgi:hypothetical protein|nr:hypothetical protein [Clostridia bacterium]